ncbi:MAG TPA: chloride channel protein [Mycobacteriales bacterium]|nr:chloride channel protein [Mycobacteriales bacterium]
MLFALEVLLLSTALVDVVVTAVTVAIATAVSLLFLPDRSTFLVPSLHGRPVLLLGALAVGPIAGVVAAAFTKLTGAARNSAARGWRLIPGCVAAFAGLAVLGIFRPEVLGNGKGPAQLALTGSLALPVAAALLLLKPIATAVCLRGGAVGGMLMPAFATGSLAGLLVGHAWAHLVTGTQPGAFAVLGGGAVLAGTMRAPLTALALGIELTGVGPGLALPLAIAVGGSFLTCRTIIKRLNKREAQE